MDKKLLHELDYIVFYNQRLNECLTAGRTSNIYRLKLKKRIHNIATMFHVSYYDTIIFLRDTVGIDIQSLVVEF